MVLRFFRVSIAAAVLLSAWCACSDSARAANGLSGPNDLFYNFYVAPVWEGGVGAQLYPAPRPTPPKVGHTYFTYQPFMPHELLYRHRRTYFRYHPTGQVTRTRVGWR